MSDFTTPTRKCTKCGTEYPVTAEHFYREKKGKYGFHAACKKCMAAASMCYAEAYPEKIRARNQRFYKTHLEQERDRIRRYREGHREQMREAQRRHYAEYPEQERDRGRQWREANPDKNRKAERRWRQEHPEQKRTHRRNHRALKRAAEGTHTASDIEVQHQRQHGKCYYCDCKMIKSPHKPNSATVDHVVPLDRGGRNSPDNLVIACRSCNSSKKNKLPHEWNRGGRLL